MIADLCLLISHLKAAQNIAQNLKSSIGLEKEIKKIEEIHRKIETAYKNKGGVNYQKSLPLLNALKQFCIKMPNMNVQKFAYLAEAIHQYELGDAISLDEEQFRRFEAAQSAIKNPPIYVIAKSEDAAYEYIDSMPKEQSKVAIACTPATFKAVNSAAIANGIVPSKVVLVSINVQVFTANKLLTIYKEIK